MEIKSPNKINILSFLASVPLFKGLSEDEINSFIKNSIQQEYKKNSQIFNYGEPADYYYIILEGWVKLYHINKEGEETVISILTKGDTFSEVSTFEGSDYPHSAQVVGGKAKFLAIKSHVFREKVRQNPNLALKMLTSISHQKNQLSLIYEHITKLTTAQRLGCFLLKLSMDRGFESKFNMPYSKHLVASELGMQPETFSRAMKRLSTDLSIEFNGKEVSIDDIDDLQDYCEIECFNDNNCDIEKRLNCSNPQCGIYRIYKLM